jgi:hypothetical protein
MCTEDKLVESKKKETKGNLDSIKKKGCYKLFSTFMETSIFALNCHIWNGFIVVSLESCF